MARKRTNATVVVSVGILIALVTGGVAWRFISGSPDSAEPQTAQSRDAAVGAAPDVGLASADRPGETVQALAADQETIKSRIDGISSAVEDGIGSLVEQIGRLGEDVSSLRTEQESLADGAAADSRIEQLRAEMLANLQALREQFDNRSGPDYPVGGDAAPGPSRGVPGQDGYIWFAAASPEPVGGVEAGLGLAALQQGLNIPGASPLAPAGDVPPEPLPAYTIPSNTTLVRSRSLTALIGRVPLNGQVTDPFPFQIITGRDNLLAGGHVLPELERAIWSGTATGDATLHCVTGRISQVTFIFRDGTISSLGEAGGDASGPLGWISNEQGYPCIPGKFVSNLQENLGKFASASFASSLSQAWSEQQTTTIQEGGAVTRAITGDPAEYALGRGISGGIDEWSRILAERAREAFDAVVVPPGQTVSIHVGQSIPIDWPPEGRRIRHVSSMNVPGAAERSGGLD